MKKKEKYGASAKGRLEMLAVVGIIVILLGISALAKLSYVDR